MVRVGMMVRILRFRATRWHYNLAQFYGTRVHGGKNKMGRVKSHGVAYTQGCAVMVPCQWGH